MTERYHANEAQALLENIDLIMGFAEQQRDYLLAAKLEDVIGHIKTRYASSAA